MNDWRNPTFAALGWRDYGAIRLRLGAIRTNRATISHQSGAIFIQLRHSGAIRTTPSYNSALKRPVEAIILKTEYMTQEF